MKGILFKPEMIKAITEGRKTVTRRVIKPQPHYEKGVLRWDKGKISINMDDHSDLTSPYARYQAGETVYIKEAAWYGPQENRVEYDLTKNEADNATFYGARKKSPLFMPAWAARYFIQILDVRAERLQLPLPPEELELEGGEQALPMLEKINGLWVFRYEFKLVANKRGRE